MSNTPAHRPPHHLRFIFLLAIALAMFLYLRPTQSPKPTLETPAITLTPFSASVGKIHPPLPYRIISFHRGGIGAGRGQTKLLIQRAAQLGFNGVQFQIEGSNEAGIAEFAERDAKDHLIDYCHSLHMNVTIWVHELSDLPGPWLPEYLGPVSADNQTLWTHIAARYDWILDQAIPNADGLVLTVVETQVRATSTPILLKLVDLIGKKCQARGKSLIVRTFVWTPTEFDGVMAAIDQLPKDTLVMSKIVPQDWQMRGTHAAEIGAVNNRPQIVEFDAAGEYFLHNSVANCMVDLLKQQYDYAVSKGAQGICVRADRFDDNVLFEPNEVNLWTLGLLAAGAADNTDDIWQQWAANRYGPKAAPAVIAALKPTADVVAELLSVGPFTYGDTRAFPRLPDEDLFSDNWQNWRWDKAFLPDLQKADAGDPAFIAHIQQQKQSALALAAASLKNLEAAKSDLPDADYQILHTRLLSNQFQLQFRTPIALAALHYRQLLDAPTVPARQAAFAAYQSDLKNLRDVAATLSQFPKPQSLDYLGKTYLLNAPLNINREDLYHWAYDASFLPNQD